MTFNKPPEWGRQFSFPENIQISCYGDVGNIVSEIAVKMVERYDDAIAQAIAMEVKREGAACCVVLNKKAILEAIRKQTPEKPTYVDTRFRNHGRHVGDGVSLDKCYKCPNCWSHIFHVWDSDIYCPKCGQALDWAAEAPEEANHENS